MKKILKRGALFALSAVLILCFTAFPSDAAKKKTGLSSKKVTLLAGKSKKIKFYHGKEKVKWEVTSGKKLITLKKKSSSGVTITAKKKVGTAVVQAKAGKKTYRCKVTVKKTAKKKTDTAAKTPAPVKKKEEKLIIEVRGQKFEAVLYNNKTVKAWKKKLPMTITMSELNRNEKYYYLSYSLPAEPEKPGTIQAGDLKLYGSDCLVLFYQSFQTAYSYTKIAKISNITDLQRALGTGSVSVKFRLG